MNDDDLRLDRLFDTYRTACPEVVPGAHFMPNLWMKIEARRSFWFVFQREARTVFTASAALCLILLVLNFISAPSSHVFASTYADALMADHTAEKTYYTEALRSTPAQNDEAPQR
jgi:hypothetical protein